jgi:NitT/TauT family transport system permease protein
MVIRVKDLKKGNYQSGGKLFRQNILWTILAWMLFFAVWEGASLTVGNGYLLPSPIETIRAGKEILKANAFYTAFFSTFFRSLKAFFLSFFDAILISVAAHFIPPIHRLLKPIISAMRSLPTMAILLMLLVGSTPSTAPIIVSFLALFPIFYSAMSSCLVHVNKQLVEMSHLYHVPKRRQFFCLYLPACIPHLLREGAGALAFSLKLTVSAEILSNTYKSLGGMLQEAKIYAEIPTLFFLTLFIVLTGVILEFVGISIAKQFERRLE